MTACFQGNSIALKPKGMSKGSIYLNFEGNAVMRVALPILGATMLQGTDMLESMGRLLGNLSR
jgi:hypothetical protein